MLYHWYELGHVAVRPARAAANGYRLFFNHPFNPFTHTPVGRHAVAACEVFERTTRRYDKPSFRIETTRVDGADVAVREAVVWEQPFCRVIHFERDISDEQRAESPRVLLVAPLSGHFATLLRGTVETLLQDHEVYITDWTDARDVPALAGSFDLDDYIEYLMAIFRHFEGDVHVFAVCQPSVPVMAAMARATATRCCWPPESSRGRRCSSPAKPSSCNSAMDRSFRSASGTPCSSITYSTFSSADSTGIKLYS